MRKYIIIALVLVALGIGASLFLFQNQSETDHARARDQQEIDLSNVDVEAEYNQGRRSFPIVSALADKRINEGNRAAALAVLEEYVKANPNDALGHKKLAEQYMLSARQADYNNELVALAALDPTEENLRTLSYVYNGDKNYPKQIETLKKLVEVTKGENPKYYVDTATMQEVVGDNDGALQTLEALKAKHPDYRDFAVTRIQVSILASKGQIDQAFTLAKEWADTPRAAFTPPPAAAVPPSVVPGAPVNATPTAASREAEELADLCNTLHYTGHADKAVELVQPHLALIDESTTLAVAYINSAIDAGKSDDAYKLLTEIDAKGKMSPDLAVPYLQLAIQREDITAAKHIAETANLSTYNELQALNLIEAARASNQPSVLNILLTRAGTPEMLKDKPVLAAVVGILSNSKDQDHRIDVALNAQLASQQRLRLAESCARANKKACFDKMVAQYPAVDKMTTPQIVEYSQLYIIAHRPEEVIHPVGLEAAKPSAHPDVIYSHIRLAAAAGDASVLQPWLTANAATVPIAKLQELFFLANDHHHTAVAVDIAERLYGRDPSPMNRNILVAAYTGNGTPEKALPIVRDALVKSPGSDDTAYISALSAAARKDPAARKELTDYAEAALKSGQGDDRAKLGYVFALLNNGKRDVAMPYIKNYAATDKTGEWKKLYGQLNLRPGSGAAARKLSRNEMLAIANSPKTSARTKHELAFALMADGDKADAESIFKQLADGKAADSQEVKELLYFWGGKLNQQQLAWVKGQAAKASPYDKQKWSEVVATYSDDRSILEYVSANPQALYNANTRKKYFRVLAEQGGKRHYDEAMRDWVAQTTDVPALMDYATTAQGYNFQNAAQNGYTRVVQLDPTNAKALEALSTLTYAKGNYSQSAGYVDRTLDAVRTQPNANVDTSVTHFYKANLFKNRGDQTNAQIEFAAVIADIQRSGDQSPEALSRMYTSQFNIGQAPQAMEGFRNLLAKYPNNKGILADYMSSLIEFHYYDEATRIANQYDTNSPTHGQQSSISQPYHTAAGDFIVVYEPTAQDAYVVVPQTVDQQNAQILAQRQQDLRLQLLYAQIEMNTGQQEKAKQRLAILDQYYPNDPQLLSFEGSIQGASGNREEAVQLLQQAQTQAPENEGIARQLYLIQHAPEPASRAGEQYVKIDHEYRKYGDPSENITTLSGVGRIDRDNEIGVAIANDHINPKSLVSPSGKQVGDIDYVKPKSANRQFADLYMSHYFDNGTRLKVAGYLSGQGDDTVNRTTSTASAGHESQVISNDGSVGVGGYLSFNTPLGASEAIAEYHKPYWDYAWAAYYNANRDRVGLRHYVDLTPTTSFSLETSLNNYSIGDTDWANGSSVGPTDDLVQSGLLRFGLVHQLQAKTADKPYFGIGYAFDGEYAFNKKRLTGTFNPVGGGGSSTYGYSPFYFYQHEAHALTGIYRDDWTAQTHVMLDAGWVYDRINNNSGPLVGGTLDQDLTDQMVLGLRGQYSKVVDSGGGDGVDVGANLKYKF